MAQQIKRDRVALPALSVRAVRAVQALLVAGADPRWRDPPPWDPDPKPGDAERASRVAPVWKEVRADPVLRAELDGFRAAAQQRFPQGEFQAVLEGRKKGAAGVPVEGVLGACVAGVLANADLLNRHQRWFAAHAEQQRRAEQARLEEERQAAARRELEATERARAEAEQAKLRRAGPRQVPRPKFSGPGPGM